MYQNLFDSHTHSQNSLDAVHSVSFMLETAVEKGVQGIAVTDHCNGDDLADSGTKTRVFQAAVDIAMAREAFAGRIILTRGIELGEPHHNYQGALELLEEHPFDFVLLALHKMRGWKDFYEVDYKALSDDDIHKMMLQYFDEMLELVGWGHFDSLAHLTLPLRYLKRYQNREVDLHRYLDPIDQVLRALVRGGKALEINTSGLRDQLRDTMPPIWMAQRFHELGGERITLGSDAHRAEDIGRGIRDGMHLLLEAGIEHFTFYRAREPVMLRII